MAIAEHLLLEFVQFDSFFRRQSAFDFSVNQVTAAVILGIRPLFFHTSVAVLCFYWNNASDSTTVDFKDSTTWLNRQ